MKKTFLLLIAVMATMSINAQVIKVFENGLHAATYTNSATSKYKVLLDKAPLGTTGEAKVLESAGITDNKVKWVQLWKDGPAWAVFNVGAKSASEYGDYYCWGSTNATDYSESTTDIQGTTDDTAMNLWGNKWQMPTNTDFINLLSTTYTNGGVWKSADESGYGIAGLLVTGKDDYASNSVFFPASGFYKPSDGLICQGTDGNYWESSPSGSNATELYFSKDQKSVTEDERDYGMFVRPILKLNSNYMPVIKVYLNDVLVATYNETTLNTYKVVLEEPTTGTTNGHGWVKIGGLKWSTMNLGATTVAGSPSTCYGDYYAWGETEPRYTSMTIASDNTATFDGWKSGYSGYNTYPSYAEAALDADHDAATQNWGSNWRTPTCEDFLALKKACTSGTLGVISSISTSNPTGGIYWLPSDQTYFSEYKGVAGILFVDKADTSMRVFFPAAGGCTNTTFENGGSSGYCWSSTLLLDDYHYSEVLYFTSTELYPSFPFLRSFGFPVRPVSE